MPTVPLTRRRPPSGGPAKTAGAPAASWPGRSDEARPPPADDARSGFFHARAASALAILPLGAWTLVHLWHNLAAFDGADAWQSAVTEYAHPFAEALTGVIVLVPLAIHAAWGLGRLAASRRNNLRHPSYG